MNWLFFALVAYFLLAIAAMIDKILLTNDIPHPSVYAFYIATLNILALGLAPFGFSILPLAWIVISLLSGAFLTLALISFFYSMREFDATRVVPFIGGATPILTILFTNFLIDERLVPRQLVAFVILVAAAVLISVDVEPAQRSGSRKHLWHLPAAAVCFSASYALTKYVFDAQPFIPVFIWNRLGSFLAGLLLLLVPAFRRQIIASLTHIRQTTTRTGPVFVVGQLAGAAGVFTQSYAISLGSVSIINALQGMQQVFILLIAALLHYVRPNLLKERFTPKSLAQKLLAVILIIVGLGLLAFA